MGISFGSKLQTSTLLYSRVSREILSTFRNLFFFQFDLYADRLKPEYIRYWIPKNTQITSVLMSVHSFLSCKVFLHFSLSSIKNFKDNSWKPGRCLDPAPKAQPLRIDRLHWEVSRHWRRGPTATCRNVDLIRFIKLQIIRIIVR